MLSTIGTGMLGLTLGCARCHDHKYDAISSREYYRLLASLHSGDRQGRQARPDGGSEALVLPRPGRRAAADLALQRGDFYDRDQPVQLGFLDVLLARADARRLLERRPAASPPRERHDLSAQGAGRLDDRRRARRRGAGRPRDRQPRLAAPFRRRAGADRQRLRRPRRAADASRAAGMAGARLRRAAAGGSSGCTG